jgi:hypothetical protein
MSAPVTREPLAAVERSPGLQLIRTANPWKVALGILAGALVLGGIIAASVGLNTVGDFEGTVLGQDQRFDEAVATAILGAGAIFLGITVGAAWLVLCAISWRRQN